jgi:hypothetical protein
VLCHEDREFGGVAVEAFVGSDTDQLVTELCRHSGVVRPRSAGEAGKFRLYHRGPGTGPAHPGQTIMRWPRTIRVDCCVAAPAGTSMTTAPAAGIGDGDRPTRAMIRRVADARARDRWHAAVLVDGRARHITRWDSLEAAVAWIEARRDKIPERNRRIASTSLSSGAEAFEKSGSELRVGPWCVRSQVGPTAGGS